MTKLKYLMVAVVVRVFSGSLDGYYGVLSGREGATAGFEGFINTP